MEMAPPPTAFTNPPTKIRSFLGLGGYFFSSNKPA